MRRYFFCIFIAYIIQILTQYGVAQEVTGKIVDNQGLPIAYANIIAQELQDSIEIHGTISNDDGSFKIGNINKFPALLSVSFVGYATRTDTIRQYEVGNIVLQTETIKIEGIEIHRQQKPLIQSRPGGLVVNIEGSRLSTEPTLQSMLAKLPGLRMDNGTLKMLGKNNLAIYIDERKATDGEMASLNPDDIVSVDILRSPGAEYSASTDAVVHIRSKRSRFSRTTNLQLSNSSSIGWGYATIPAIVATHVTDKVAQTLSYRYRLSDTKQHNIQDVQNFYNANTITKKRDAETRYKRNAHTLYYGISFKPKEPITIGAQYSGYIDKNKHSDNGTINILNDLNPLSEININKNSDETGQLQRHNIGINAKYKATSKLSMQLLSDYAYIDNNVQNKVFETNANSIINKVNTNKNHTQNIYNIFSISPKIIYQHEFIKLDAGTDLYSLSNQSTMLQTSMAGVDKVQMADLVGAAYTNATFDADVVELQLGLRGEWMRSEQTSPNEPAIRYNHKGLFPFAAISTEIGDDLSLSLSYRKSIERPSLHQLNPEFIYKDTLTYSVGNPNLKPKITHSLDFEASYLDFSFEAGLYRYLNTVTFLETPDEHNPKMLRSTYGNLDKPNSLLYLGLYHNYEFSIFKSTLGLMMNKPHTTMMFRDTLRTLKLPIWSVDANLSADITKNIVFSASYTYNSAGDDIDLQSRSYSSLNFELRAFLLKRTLMLSVGVDDVMRRDFSNTWVHEYNYVRTSMHTIPQPVISFYIRYRIGAKVDAVSKRSSSGEALNRAN